MISCRNGELLMFTKENLRSIRTNNLFSLHNYIHNYNKDLEKVAKANVVIILSDNKWKIVKNRYGSCAQASKDMILLTKLCFDESKELKDFWLTKESKERYNNLISKSKKHVLEEIEIPF